MDALSPYKEVKPTRLWKISTIAATKCHIVTIKSTKFSTPANPLAAFKGAYF